MVWVLLSALVVLIGFTRLAPSDPQRWHVVLDIAQDETLPGGVRRVILGADRAMLEDLDRIIRSTPRTTVLIGTVAGAHITYVTRSLVMGFPDYTTVQLKDDRLMIWARLRFGRSDLGVNRRRVDRWLADLEA